ncbi:hypothetical protein TUN199_09451 [Pyrenophora tritici-repentis]|uniref:Uncharacterized protein n=1 Tax=Pyrenophora tritici-repentis TaxID=45151 RepID=A0A2W1E028_9PLEO|nr:hypothetical protein PtrV1_04659 [Pyrenophora tritici-repentis]KAI0572228.1 hypothetical protein Alg215_09912 [Pyrenophora tritici-repentis]KAI0618560.1 hypothetical protein TUN199_09451 [Pyrenophora tritici-repentis]KAI1518598.1 hypothetical protein Ptr86124_001726 [Pyrenophora tritici-repentis]KAI1686178.1 hypothetical protein KJE20_04143 [Pyrenophora tritici-repentis]
MIVIQYLFHPLPLNKYSNPSSLAIPTHPPYQTLLLLTNFPFPFPPASTTNPLTSSTPTKYSSLLPLSDRPPVNDDGAGTAYVPYTISLTKLLCAASAAVSFSALILRADAVAEASFVNHTGVAPPPHPLPVSYVYAALRQ